MRRPLIIVAIVALLLALGGYAMSKRPTIQLEEVNLEIGWWRDTTNSPVSSMYFHLYSTKKFFADPNSDQHNTSSVKKSFGRYEVTLGTIKANSQLDCLKGLPDGCNESASVDDGLGVDQFIQTCTDRVYDHTGNSGATILNFC